MNRLLKLAIAPLLLIGILTGCGTGDNPSDGSAGTTDKDTSITVGLDPYNYATMPAYLSKEILENHGYDVEIKNAQVGILFAGLSKGKIDAFIDIWTPNLHASYLKKYKGEFEVAGTFYKDAPLGIVVPKYMSEVNSIPDLKKYHDKFDGKIYGIEPGTGMVMTTEKMIDEYKMDYKVVKSSAQGMLGQAKKALSEEEPIAFLGWHPHTMFKRFDIKLLKDPKDVWKFDSVKVGVVSDMKEKSPTAYRLFSNMNFSIEEVEQWLVKMKNGKEPKELAEAWVEEHKEDVNQWLGE
ncbi:MAG TPA: glycine betaine ABC transporter substrate-binding protein [Bacillales bacterium]|nr:glycine betaine ABC transporter substrate-binding protein [Bacillales bacterium]